MLLLTIKKMILWKKNIYTNLILVGLSAIYLAKSVLHLKYGMIDLLSQRAATLTKLTMNDPTRHITLLDIKVSSVES